MGGLLGGGGGGGGGGPPRPPPPPRCAPSNVIHLIVIYSTYEYNLARNLWEPSMEPYGSTALIVLSKRRKNNVISWFI